MNLTTTQAGRRLLVAAAALVTALVLAVMVSALIIRSQDQPRSRAPQLGSADRRSPAPDAPASGDRGGLTDAQSAAVNRDVAALAGTPVVLARTSAGYPAVPDAQRAQADTYAAAFATELLRQNYRVPRGQLLAWVQSESTTSSEPTVVGLVPAALRSRLAVYSLTVPSADGTDPVPVPDAADWARWAAVAGNSTVAITRVSEPQQWLDAVRAGRLTDPGITARTVDAVITTHWTQKGVARSARREATLVMTMEGPPTRGVFGFVCAVTYHETAVS